MAVFLLFLLVLVSPVLSEFAAEDSLILQVHGETEFSTALRDAPLVFAKFFHPKCSHCQAIREPYLEVARRLAFRNATIRLIAIDISRKVNRALLEQYSSRGVPTLLLFSERKEEFHGARDANSMVKWLQDRLAVRDVPPLTLLNTTRQRDQFIALHAKIGAPVVLALYAPPATDDLNSKVALAANRKSNDFQVAYARVADVMLLGMPKLDSYGVLPYVAVIRKEVKGAQWWFPGVLGGETLASFLVTSTLPRDGTAQLTRSNAVTVTGTTRAVLYAFGSRTTPDASTMEQLKEFAIDKDLVVVYAHDLEFEDLGRHLGLKPITDDERKMPRRTQYALQLAGTHGSERSVHTDGKLSQWVDRFMGDHTYKRGIGGEVSMVNTRTWNNVLDHDGRTVVVCITSGRMTCLRAMKMAAIVMQNESRRVRFVIYENKSTVKIAGVDVPDKRPYVAVVLPGEKPTVVENAFNSHQIVDVTRSAMKKKRGAFAVAVTQETDTIGLGVTYLGFLLIIMGIALIVQKDVLVKRFRALSGRVDIAAAKSV